MTEPQPEPIPATKLIGMAERWKSNRLWLDAIEKSAADNDEDPKYQKGNCPPQIDRKNYYYPRTSGGWVSYINLVSKLSIFQHSNRFPQARQTHRHAEPVDRPFVIHRVAMNEDDQKRCKSGYSQRSGGRSKLSDETKHSWTMRDLRHCRRRVCKSGSTNTPPRF